MMKRLDAETLAAFVEDGAVAVVMFAAPTGATTMAQAEAFADAWADNPEVRFGYLDAKRDDIVASAFGVQRLPTTLVFRSGAPSATFEGFASCDAICAALQAVCPSPVHGSRRTTSHQIAA